MSQNLSEQEIIRRATLADIRQAGIDPYPAATYPVNTTSAEILALFDTTPERFTEVNIAGRLMMTRSMGKASFAVLMDSYGKIQLYLKKDELGKPTIPFFQMARPGGFYWGIRLCIPHQNG